MFAQTFSMDFTESWWRWLHAQHTNTHLDVSDKLSYWLNSEKSVCSDSTGLSLLKREMAWKLGMSFFFISFGKKFYMNHYYFFTKSAWQTFDRVEASVLIKRHHLTFNFRSPCLQMVKFEYPSYPYQFHSCLYFINIGPALITCWEPRCPTNSSMALTVFEHHFPPI